MNTKNYFLSKKRIEFSENVYLNKDRCEMDCLRGFLDAIAFGIKVSGCHRKLEYDSCRDNSVLFRNSLTSYRNRSS